MAGWQGFPTGVFSRTFPFIYDEELKTHEFLPPCDVQELENGYQITLEVPGVNKEDISVEVKRGFLTISGEKKEEAKEEKSNYVRNERRYGSFSRSFKVQNLDESTLEATLKDGLLRVHLPKVEPQPAKKVEIKSL